MYNYPLYYIHTASYYNPSCHPQPVKQEQRLYLQQALELVADKLAKFEANGNVVDQLSEKSWVVEFADFTDPITVNIAFDLDCFKRNYSHYFWKLTRDNNKDKSNVFADILFTDKFVVDLSVLSNKGKLVITKQLTTNSTNVLTIEDELENTEIVNLQLGDILLTAITNKSYLSNIDSVKSLKIIKLHNCYYQPKQIVNLCSNNYLTINVILDIKGDKYLLTTEEDKYCNLLEAYNSVLGCARKVDFVNFQYAHIEYIDLWS
jgi:hypothetical protein